MQEVLQLEVVGRRRINCERCEARIANGLSRLPGVENVEASAQTQRVRVAIDPARTSTSDVRAAMTELGYQVG